MAKMWALYTHDRDCESVVAVSRNPELLKRRAEEMIHPRSQNARDKVAKRWRLDEEYGSWSVSVRNRWLDFFEIDEIQELET